MYILGHSGRRMPKMVGPWPWPVPGLALALALAATLTMAPACAWAACIPSIDPAIRRLQVQIATDGVKALRQIRVELEAEAARKPAPLPATLAALYAVQAEAYGLLELAAESQAAAARGLALATDVHDPVHLQLLSADAENAFDARAIDAAIASVEKARIAQTPGSLGDTCLLITRGLLENRQDRADLAISSLTRAYGATTAPAMMEAHIRTASILSIIMRGMGDYTQALALNQQEIDWQTANRATLSLSVARFMRGQILKLMGNYSAAVTEFSEARKMSVELDDEQGVAYADLRLCESHIELKEIGSAQQECNAAGRVFASSHVADGVKETQSLLARVELQLGRPENALAILNDVLDQNGADMSPLHVAALYESRARANAALHNYRNAYSDLNEYVRRHAAANAAERFQQAGALRARFETDREIERNAKLKRELTVSQEQALRQARELRWNSIVVVVGVCVIAMLVYFLASNRRYRQQLQRLAHHDGLTGLPNRRRTAELALDALQTARDTNQPLAIAIIDMDHFKLINDRCGHATGDHVLTEFARLGREALHDSHVLGRWGGEEFLLVMPGASLDQALAALERLRTLVFGIKLPTSGVGLRVSLSAGVAPWNSSVKSLDELIARADGALYVAKNEGRDLVRIADPAYVTGAHAVRRSQRL